MSRLARMAFEGLCRLQGPSTWETGIRHLSYVNLSSGHHSQISCCKSCTLLRSSYHSTPQLTSPGHHVKKSGRKPSQSKKSKSREVVTISSTMTVAELAEVLQRTSDQIYAALERIPTKVDVDSQNSVNNLAAIKEVVELCGYRWKLEAKQKKTDEAGKDAVRRPAPPDDLLVKRPPIVTVMGHVDHGKTTLLDALRHSHVVDEEFGGITQHIGAFSVKLASSEESITFLDTPGHAAFFAMRSRGAHVTDIVVLVVAADDGVMQQTIESIEHAKSAGAQIVVAINKCDKHTADAEEARRELQQHGLISEEDGGDTQMIPISALKGTGLDILQEAILAQAELLELRCDVTGLVEGVVIEACVDAGRGKLATVLIQRGTLTKGAYLVAGTAHAKVRGMFSDQGRPVQEATPGCAVEVIGWREMPSAGDLLLQVETEHRAREVIHWREEQEKATLSEEQERIISAREDLHREEYQRRRQRMKELGIRISRRLRDKQPRTKEVVTEHGGLEMAIVLKGDVHGTVEAILDTMDLYTSDQCRLHMLSYGVGDVTEQDVHMAASFQGDVFCFNVRSSEKINKLARELGVKVKHHNVIYKMMDDLRECLQNKLPNISVEHVTGEANVLQTFTITDGKKKIPVAGCLCTKGVLHKKKLFRLVRGEQVLLEGEVASLKHFKNEVESVKLDVECGIAFEDRSVTPQTNDSIICYEMKEEKQILKWDINFQ